MLCRARHKSHARRKIWETAITSKDPIAREGLARVSRIFALDRTWKGRPHPEIKSLRELHLRPHIDAFFTFVAAEYECVKDRRGMLVSADQLRRGEWHDGDAATVLYPGLAESYSSSTVKLSASDGSRTVSPDRYGENRHVPSSSLS